MVLDPRSRPTSALPSPAATPLRAVAYGFRMQGLSASAFSAALGISVPTLRQWTSGRPQSALPPEVGKRVGHLLAIYPLTQALRGLGTVLAAT